MLGATIIRVGTYNIMIVNRQNNKGACLKTGYYYYQASPLWWVTLRVGTVLHLTITLHESLIDT